MTGTTTNTAQKSHALVAGGVLTGLSAFAVQFVVVPATDVADTEFSYPWTPETLIPVSIVYAVFHLLVAIGLAQVARPFTGAIRGGLWTAVIGTVLLVAGELATIPLRERLVDDSTVGLVTGPLFGGGTVLTVIGLLIAGVGLIRQQRTPFAKAVLVAGVWTVALLGLIVTPVMAAAIGVYGVTLAAIGWTADGAP
jgi:hypothetical protein